MATYQCPKGHTSTDPDYCSECGALIGSSTVASATLVTSASSAGADVCPKCTTPRTPGARFCEVCRYDFEAVAAVASVSSPPVAAVASSSPAVAAPPAPSSTPLATVPTRLNVVVVIDPSLVEDEEMRKQCPQGEPELVFPLDMEENLVGRRSENKKIYPEIALSDPGVSHRHLKFIKQADGSFAALELGSANGTTLNGVELKPGAVTPVAAGDELLVGTWTRLRLRSR